MDIFQRVRRLPIVRFILRLLKNILSPVLECIKVTVTSERVLNRLAPVVYLFAYTGIVGWGLFVAIPYLYNDNWPRLCSAVQGVGFFIATEILVNWLCLVFVDTEYRQSDFNNIRVEQANFQHGEQQSLGHRSNELHGNSNKMPRKDATAVEIPNHHVGVVPTGAINNDVDVCAGQMPPPIGMPIVAPKPKKSVDRYFLWSYCQTCNQTVPPRSHHCNLCQKCILKRDHHCFVAARCIGYHNLRHFAVFVFYTTLGTAFGVVHALPYAVHNVIPFVSYPDLFYLIAIVRGLLGYLEMYYMLLIVLGWLCLGYLMFSLVSLYRVYKIITCAKTSFETVNKLDVTDTRDTRGRIEAVFGKNWYLNYIVPCHFIYPPVEDPIRWPHVKYNVRYEPFR